MWQVEEDPVRLLTVQEIILVARVGDRPVEPLHAASRVRPPVIRLDHDRAYWDAKAGRETMAVVDSVVTIIKAIDPAITPKYNRWYIGLARNNQPLNFVVFRPKSQWVRVEVKLEKADELQKRLEETGLDLMEYSTREGRYKLRLSTGDPAKHADVLRDLFRSSFDAFTQPG